MWADLPVVYILLFSYSFSAIHLVQKRLRGELMMEAGDKEKEGSHSEGTFFTKTFHYFISLCEERQIIQTGGIVAQHASKTQQRWVVLMQVY